MWNLSQMLSGSLKIAVFYIELDMHLTDKNSEAGAINNMVLFVCVDDLHPQNHFSRSSWDNFLSSCVEPVPSRGYSVLL